MSIATIVKQIYIVTLLFIFTYVSYTQAPQKTGVLREAVQVPLLMNGKQVGTSTAAAGAKVRVISEADGKLLLAVSGGQVWVTLEKVDVQDVPPAPAVAAAPTPAMPLVAGETSKVSVLAH